MASRTTSIKITGNVTQALAALDALGIKSEEVAKKTEKDLGGAAQRTGGLFGKLGEQMANWGIPFASAITKSSEKMKESEHEAKGFGATLAEVGKVAAIAGAAGFAVIGDESIKAATKFQSAMELIHTQAGASQQEVNSMSKAVLNLAGPTATAPDELAAGLYHLESAGMRGAKALDALKTAALGAKVGHANLEDVTNALNAAIASGIPGVQNMQQAMGALNAIVGAGDMRMQDLAEAMGTGVLASVKSYGLSLNDVGAALATFGDNNIRGSDAATQLRMAVMAFAVPAKTAKGALEQLHMTTTQLGQDMRTGGLTKALTDLHEHLVATGNSGVKAGQLLTQAFGKKAGTGINVLIDQFGRYESKTKEVAAGAGTFSQSVAATQKTLQYQMDEAKASVEALGIKFGQFLIPKVQEAAGVLAKVVNWLEQHKTVAEVVAAVVGGVLAGAFVAWAASLFMAGGALEFLMGPLGLVMLAIAATIAVVVLLSKHWHQVWGDIKAWTEDAWHFIDKALHNGVVEAVMAVFAPLLLLATHWRETWSIAKQVTSDAYNDVIKPIFDAIRFAAIEPVQYAIQAFVDVWQTQIGLARDVISGAYNDVIRPIFGFIETVAIDPVKAAIQGFEDVWNTVWGGVQTAVSDAWSVIQPIIDTIKQAVQDAENAINGLGSAAHAVGGAVGGAITGKHGLTHGFGLWAQGGWVNAPAGTAVPGFVHGQEYVLSTAMLDGSQQIDPVVLASLMKQIDNGPTGGGFGTSTPTHAGSGAQVTNNVYAQTNADPVQIAREIEWLIQQSGGLR